MLELSYSRIRHSKDLPVTADTVVAEEGLALVQVLENGKETATVSGYEGATRFIGFSYGETMRPLTKSAVEELVLTTMDNIFTLKGTPLPDQIMVKDATGTVFAAADAPAAGSYQLNGAVITFDVADAGKKVTVRYRYVPTEQELVYNDRLPFQFATGPELYGRIGVILNGEVFTDQFDASIDWENPAEGHVLVALEGGIVSMAAAGSGVEIPGMVISVPGTGNPYLGLRI